MRRAAAGAAAALACVAAPTAAGAQRRTPVRPPGAPAMLVAQAFRSGADHALGRDAAAAVRDRLARDIPATTLWQVPGDALVAMLPGCELACADSIPVGYLRELATVVRAGEILDAGVRREGTWVVIEPRLVLARDARLVQPLPPARGRTLDEAAAVVSSALQATRRQLDGERACTAELAARRFDEAAAAARQAIAIYPRSTLARLCLARTFATMLTAPDSVAIVSTEVLTVHPHNEVALELLAEANAARGQRDRALDAWMRLLAVTPAPPTDVERTVTRAVERVDSAAAARAVVRLDRLAANDSAAAAVQALRFRLLLALREWRRAAAAGESLARADSAYVDTTFVARLHGAYVAAGDTAAAFATAARGVYLYLDSPGAWVLYARSLRMRRLHQESLDAARKAIALRPAMAEAWAEAALSYVELGQPGTALTAARRGSAAADSAGRAYLSNVLLRIGNQMVQAAQQSRRRADFERAVPFLALTDTLSGGGQVRVQARFLIGASWLLVGQQALSEASAARSCEMARQAQSDLQRAAGYLPVGTEAPRPDQFTGLADRVVATLCTRKRGDA
ncbi:MAG TPA: hypothetical protein VKA84_20895 [Gemmatimonadaceae bacterium]|nr:hypothetical protein [Gemmatimonadaceae bacterium]